MYWRLIARREAESIADEIVTNQKNIVLFMIKDYDAEAWARNAGFNIKYNLD